MEIEFHPLAEIESEEATLYYEDRAEGLGLRYVDELNKAFDHIIQFPEAWPLVGSSVRKIGLNRFPFLVIYSIEEKYLLVLAVAHTRRKPFYWKDRMQGSEP